MQETPESPLSNLVLDQVSKISWGARAQVILDKREDSWLIHLRGEFGLECADKLKALLLAGLASGKDLKLDLLGVSEIDITTMQLILAAQKETSSSDRCRVGEISESASKEAQEAGFECFPGVATHS